MKFVITENQFKSLVMEVDEKDLQKVSNYITRAVRTKFPVVDEIDIQSVFTPDQIEKKSEKKRNCESFYFCGKSIGAKSW